MFKYTAIATATGQGRNGEVVSDGEAGLSLHLSTPKALGGKEDGQNPEQLFAMGVSILFPTQTSYPCLIDLASVLCVLLRCPAHDG